MFESGNMSNPKKPEDFLGKPPVEGIEVEEVGEGDLTPEELDKLMKQSRQTGGEVDDPWGSTPAEAKMRVAEDRGFTTQASEGGERVVEEPESTPQDGEGERRAA